jgi:hypothetical protein
MNKFFIALFAAAALAAGFNARPALAQPSRSELVQDVTDLTTLDPDIEKFLPRWRIQEADLKIKLATYFKGNGIPVSETDSMIVTATFPEPTTGAQELLTIRVGANPEAVISGTQALRSAFGEQPGGLYDQIRDRNYAHEVIEPEVPLTATGKERIANVMQPTTAKQFIAISAFRQAVQIGTTGARLEHLLGNDEIGYHFWSSGQGKAELLYPIIRLEDAALRSKGVPDILTMMLGVGYRLKIGGDSALNEIITPRKLNGAVGAKALAKIEYRLPQVNDLGFSVYAEVPFSKQVAVEEVNANNQVASTIEILKERNRPNTDTLRGAYFLRTVAQGAVFWETWLNDYEHFFRISLGASYQEITHRIVTSVGNPVLVNRDMYNGDGVELAGIRYETPSLYHPQELEDWVLAKIEYLNQSGFPFGVTAQLANRNLLLSGFIPVIPNFLFIEAKYSTPLLRENPAAWENKSFFMISPIIRFKID